MLDKTIVFLRWNNDLKKMFLEFIQPRKVSLRLKISFTRGSYQDSSSTLNKVSDIQQITVTDYNISDHSMIIPKNKTQVILFYII